MTLRQIIVEQLLRFAHRLSRNADVRGYLFSALGDVRFAHLEETIGRRTPGRNLAKKVGSPA